RYAEERGRKATPQMGYFRTGTSYEFAWFAARRYSGRPTAGRCLAQRAAMRFEVRIPAPNNSEFDTLITVDASSWMSALRSALERVGRPASSQALLCDIQLDRSVRVIDQMSRAVYLLKPIETLEPTQPGDAVDTLEMSPTERIEFLKKLREEDSGDELAVAPTPPSGVARIVNQHQHPSGSFAVPRALREQAEDDALLEQVMRELRWSHEEERSLQEVSLHVLDLAMRWIPSESGAILVPGLQRRDLFFTAARGPKAEAVMSFKVPVGSGIIGFCVQEGVSLAVQDAQSDERLDPTIGLAIGTLPQTLLCAPLKYEGRVFGAIELINKVGGACYSLRDVGLLTHIASQMANTITLEL
ncbi:MAG: hypothetical protein CO108_09505, partial [Deltaproteobacteria bacterium CG_4_9_14_3_um_filter_63_12]